MNRAVHPVMCRPFSLECGDLSPLWSAATCRSLGRLNSLQASGVKPPQAKAVTGHRIPKSGTSLEMGEAHGEAQPMPPVLYTYVEDVDAAHERAVKAGAASVQSPTDQPYGDRTAWLKDAWGNVWYLPSQIVGQQ
jgi:uncharacterized glyoxalase superfamily protein PhnB